MCIGLEVDFLTWTMFAKRIAVALVETKEEAKVKGWYSVLTHAAVGMTLRDMLSERSQT